MYKSILKITLFLLLILQAVLPQSATAQQPQHLYANNSNVWISYTGSHKISSKWGLHLEAQERRSDWIKDNQQLLLRAGINYYLNPQTTLTAGYCYVKTYPYGDFPAKTTFPENRFWEQLQLKNQIGKIEWISRFRLENRLVNTPVVTDTTTKKYEPGDAVFTNRFRLLNRFSIPFKGNTITDKNFYATAFDELFVNFGKNVAANFFDQNRVFVGIGYKVPKFGRIETGYMYQNIFKPDGIKIENNSTIVLAFISNLDFYKPKSKTATVIPAQQKTIK